VILTVLLFPTLLAVLGLALDGGMMYQARRRMQAGADAAALAGVWELFRGNSGLVEAAARDDARLNGFNDGVNATVAVNNPPTSGAWSGVAGYVEVIVSRDVPTTFLRVVGREYSTVRARAVAGSQRYMDFCVLALNPTQSGSMIVQGTSSLDAGCGVMVNSKSDSALELGGGACLTGAAVGVTGGYTTMGSIECLDPLPDIGVPPVLDPLAYLIPPPIPATPVADRFRMTGGAATLNPGLYMNGFDIQSGVVTFNPGIYIIDGGFHIGGGVVANGVGVMFYITNVGGGPWGRVQIDGSAVCNFWAPDSGPYEGVLIWMDRNAPDTPPGSFIAGTPGSKFEGALYFPSIHVTLGGTNSSASWTMVVADTIDIQGTAAVPGNVANSSISPPAFKPTLVE
jgi:hypothetical protein